MVPWNPKCLTSVSISRGNTKLPAAVPDTQIPFAKARCLSKYCDTNIIPGVVDNPPPIPKINNFLVGKVLLVVKLTNF